MHRKTQRRCIHLAGESMTACGKIVSGSMRVRRGTLDGVMPSWRCKACQRWIDGRKAARGGA